MNTTYNQILNDLYNDVFLEESDSTVNIFLCGASILDELSIRNRIYKAIRDIAKTNVVLPEWLFSDLLAKPEYNLLTLEGELAGNVDLIIVPLEGYGTVVNQRNGTLFEPNTLA